MNVRNGGGGTGALGADARPAMLDADIRRTTLDDLDLLMHWRMEVLSEVFADVWEHQNFQELYDENFNYYKEMLESGQHIAVFAEAGGTPIGCGGVCFSREMPSPDNPNGRCAYLMNIYVREAYRRKGVAKRIVTTLIAEAQDAGANKIYLETSELGRPLYESLGFADMEDYMKLPAVSESPHTINGTCQQ